MTQTNPGIRDRLCTLSAEFSGALGDLGTFLPYVIAITGAGILAPTPVFAAFAAGYVLVALVYRCPVAVQPMKAVGALIIAGSLSAPEVAWTVRSSARSCWHLPRVRGWARRRVRFRNRL